MCNIWCVFLHVADLAFFLTSLDLIDDDNLNTHCHDEHSLGELQNTRNELIAIASKQWNDLNMLNFQKKIV